MTYQEWQKKRSELTEVERRERMTDLDRARTPLQVAVTEQAIRQLYDLVAGLSAKLEAREQKGR